nr:hypothetical protein [Tanacetum cinerariifolium]
MDSIEQGIIERANHKQELQNGLKRLNERKLQIQECKSQSNTSGDKISMSRNECNDKITYGDDTNIKLSYDMEPMVEVPYTAEYNVFAIDTQHSKQTESTSNTCLVEKDDSNVTSDLPNMCENDIQTDQNAEDERAALANLVANLNLDVDENKKI